VLTKNPSAIIYTPADPVAGGIPLRTVSQDDVTVINVDAKLAASSLYTSFIASDHYAGAEMITKRLAEQIGGAGQVAVVSGLPSNPITQPRVNGFKAALKAYPKIKVVSISYPDITPSAQQSTASSLLAKYRDLKAFYTTNFLSANGTAVALRNANLVGKVKMVSWDAGASNVKLLQEGVLNETVAQEPYVMGQLAIQQIAKKLQGKPTTKSVSAPVTVLTSADVNSPEGKKLWYRGKCSED
jgi:ribose transport system substrate-binding protein